MVVKAIVVEANEIEKIGKDKVPDYQRLDCIYDDEPLELEKDPLYSDNKMQACEPL